MAAPKRTDVDWPRIHHLYTEGVTPYSISNMLAEEGVKLSKQAIMQRAEREGWERPATSKPAPRPAPKPKAAPKPQDTPKPKQETASPPATVAPDLKWPANPMSQEQRVVLQSVALTGLTKHAALAAGVTEETFAKWCEDPIFADQLKQALGANATTLATSIQEAAQRGEWRAGIELLKTLPAFRDEFGEKDRGGKGTLVVNFKFDLVRGAIPRDEDIITLEHEPGRGR